MKITVITGSPHKDGTSALLADKFIEGAKKQPDTMFFGLMQLLKTYIPALAMTAAG